jgi:glycosyltransferase domain-containing protein
MSLLNKLTIVIPTYNRPEFLKRSINYWKDTEANILIIDGSEVNPFKNELVYLDNNIKYIYTPTPLANRLRIAISTVETEFVTLLGDDEYFIPQSLEKSIEFLETNFDYVACGGQAVHFTYQEESHSVMFKPAYQEFYSFDLSIADPNLRVIEHFKNYTCSYIYSVMRAKEWKSAMYVPANSDFTAYGNGEYAFEFVACYLGKSKMLPNLSWFRSLENGRNITNEKGTNPKNSFSVWWKSWKYRKERGKFKQYIYASLPIPLEISSKVFENTYYTSFNIFYSNFGYTLKKKIRHNLARIKLIKFIYDHIMLSFFSPPNDINVKSNISDFYDSIKILNDFTSRGVNVQSEDFYIVHESILSIYNK